MNMDHIIFSKSTVQSRKKRGANRCKTFSFNGWNKFLSDSIIFNFIVILCTTHVMTRSVVTGNLTSISCHSGAQFFYNNLYPTLSGQSFLSEHGHCKSIFHSVLQPILSPLLLYIYVHISYSQIVFLSDFSCFLLHKISVKYTCLYFSIVEVLLYIIEPCIPCNDVFSKCWIVESNTVSA